MKKKPILFLLPFFLLFLFAIPLALALAFASATTITIGDVFSEADVTVPIMINEVKDAVSATINLSYDPSVIVVTDVREGDLNFGFEPNLDYAEEGWVRISAFNIEGMSGNVKFAELTITPVGRYGAFSNLEIEVETLSDSKGKIDAEVKNGSFTIKASAVSDTQGDSSEPSPTPSPSPSPAAPSTPSPSVNETTIHPSSSPSQTAITAVPVRIQIGDIAVEKGKTATTPILIKGVVEKGISSAIITLIYDLSVVEVESAGESDFGTFVEKNVPSEGCLKMVAFQTSEGRTGDIKFAELKLKAVGKANESSELKLEVKELTDNEGFPVHFETENGYFLIKMKVGEKAEAEAEPELSKPIIPTLSVVEIIAVIVIAGSCFIIKRRRRK